MSDLGVTEQRKQFSLFDKDGFLSWSFTILFIFGAPFLLFLIAKVIGDAAFKPFGCAKIEKCPAYLGLNWLAIISCAALFGAIGVTLSLMTRRKLDEQMFQMPTPKLLLVVYLIGATFAILMLTLFIGGFVQGNLFPDLSQTDSWISLRFRMKDWAKLITWSFIAGFSERLMPTLFDQLVDKLLTKDNPQTTTQPVA